MKEQILIVDYAVKLITDKNQVLTKGSYEVKTFEPVDILAIAKKERLALQNSNFKNRLVSISITPKYSNQ